jgi:serine protease Do
MSRRFMSLAIVTSFAALTLLPSLTFATSQVNPPATPAPAAATVVTTVTPASAPPAAAAVVVPPVGAPMSFADLAVQVQDAVVNISTTQKIEAKNPAAMLSPQGVPLPDFPPGSPFQDFFEDFFNNQLQQQGPMAPIQSLGSGFVIDSAKGLVVTNNHVVDQADEIKVILHDDTQLDATVVGRDAKTDLALLKVKAAKPLKQVIFGDSNSARVGDWVLAVGNPFGLGGTVTAGIISARQRNINAGQYDDFIQTDAPINRGNSGGPLFNLRGEVIGINTAIFSPSGGSVGIGFAVPSDLAQDVIKQLAEFGQTRRGWLGVRIQDVTPEIADTLGLKTAQGALVASLAADGPAAKAGLKPGDVIMNFDGKGVEAMRRLPRIVADTEIGKTVTLSVWRQGKIIETKAIIGQLEKAEEKGLVNDNDTPNAPQKDEPVTPQKMSALKLSVAPLTPALRQRFGITASVANGVVITQVENASDAVMKGLRPGDVIMEINQRTIKTVADFNGALDTAKTDKKNSVLLLVNSEGNLRFVAVKLSVPAK